VSVRLFIRIPSLLHAKRGKEETVYVSHNFIEEERLDERVNCNYCSRPTTNLL